VVGRENIVAGTDCGLGSLSTLSNVEPEVAWAELRSLVEGARLNWKAGMVNLIFELAARTRRVRRRLWLAAAAARSNAAAAHTRVQLFGLPRCSISCSDTSV
jgi:hypothetical protein